MSSIRWLALMFFSISTFAFPGGGSVQPGQEQPGVLSLLPFNGISGLAQEGGMPVPISKLLPDVMDYREVQEYGFHDVLNNKALWNEVEPLVDRCNVALRERVENSVLSRTISEDEGAYPLVVFFPLTDKQGLPDDSGEAFPVCVFSTSHVNFVDAVENVEILSRWFLEKEGVILVSPGSFQEVSFWEAQYTGDDNEMDCLPCNSPLISAGSGGDGDRPYENHQQYREPDTLFAFNDDDESPFLNQDWILCGEILVHSMCPVQDTLAFTVDDIQPTPGCRRTKYVPRPGLRGGSKDGGAWKPNNCFGGGWQPNKNPTGGAFTKNPCFSKVSTPNYSFSASSHKGANSGGGGGSKARFGCGGFGQGEPGIGSAKKISGSNVQGGK